MTVTTIPAPTDPHTAGRSRGGSLPLLLAAIAAVLVLVAAGLYLSYERELEDHGGRVESVAQLQAEQVATWLEQHQSVSEYIADSPYFAEKFDRWQAGGDEAAGEELKGRIGSYAISHAFQGVALVDAQGRVLHDKGQWAASLEPEVHAALATALSSGRLTLSTIHTWGEYPRQWVVDYVAPLRRTGNPARAALVLRLNLNQELLPTLDRWPVPKIGRAHV